MAQTYWLQMDICADRSYNYFGTGLGSTDALNRLNFCGNWLYSGTNTDWPYGIGNVVANGCVSITTPGTTTLNPTGRPVINTCTTGQVTPTGTPIGTATSCASGFGIGTTITSTTNNICGTSNYWTSQVNSQQLVCVRNNNFNPSSLNSNTLSGTCYSTTMGNTYSTTDAARLYNVLAASCAFSAINCATAVTLCILCSMVRH